MAVIAYGATVPILCFIGDYGDEEKCYIGGDLA
jgi:hypothetical protein